MKGKIMVTTMRKGRKSLAAIGLSLLMAGGVLASASPASAAWTDCPSGRSCLWVGNNYPGLPNGIFVSDIVLSSSNNQINSIVNNGTTWRSRFFDSSNFTGINISLNNPARGGQTRDPLLSNGTDATPVNWANKISSAEFYS
ncbi:MAG: peptidase inhibitor family I36 protein [Acidimicrobiia bacterium]|nr:peptidase inhibitor family I36 protein [Acidimicrobiia bacterium]